jgi:maltose-binding protein MalE
MEECMKKKLGLVGIVASAALVGSTLLVPSANAATRTLIVWADDQRGPQLTTLIGGNTSIVPGYKIQVKFFSSLTALQDAWSKASAASAPDVLTGPASFVLDAKSGKLASIQPGGANQAFAKGAISAMSYSGKQYGVALDIDTTALVYNKTLFGSSAPTSLVQMVNFYNTNKASKGLVGGVCAVDGTWGTQALLNGFGGGAWDISKSKPNYTKVVLNSPAFIGNVKKYLLDSSGKSTGFFQWDSCNAAFTAGKIPFAITGAWNYGGYTKAGLSFGLSTIPGLNGGTATQWVNYSGAFLTSYASTHGVSIGARQLLLNYFASTAGQVAMYKASTRPPANGQAIAQVTDPLTLGVAQAAQGGTPQVSALLDDKAGGTNWYDTLSALYTAIFTQGKDAAASLNAAAAIEQKDFNDAAATL